MVAPFVCVLDGTWGSGDLPDEIGDFALMRGMRWSWDELQATPSYVRSFCAAYLNALGEHNQESDAARTPSR